MNFAILKTVIIFGRGSVNLRDELRALTDWCQSELTHTPTRHSRVTFGPTV